MNNIHPYVYAGLNHIKPTKDDIVNIVCLVLKIPIKVMLSKDRRRETVEARQISMYFIRRDQELSFSVIGNMFNRDHATVIHSCRQVENLLTYHTGFRKKYFKVASYIANLNSSNSLVEVINVKI